MKKHTSNFKNQIKLIGKEIDSIITFEDTVLGKNDLNAVTPSYQGAILKSVMKQLDIDSNVEIALGTILNCKFGLKVNGEYEYLDFGNYVVYSSEKQEDTNSYKITCYDKMLYSMKDYEKLNITYPITIKEYINAICEHLGLVFANKNDEFANYNKTISNDLYLDADGNSLGYTFRDVFDELAQVTASTICINDNDEVEIRYINDAFNTNKVSGLGSVSFDKAIEEDIKSLVIDGKSTQNGVSPSPDYPSEIESVGTYNKGTGKYGIEVETTGKNLIPNNFTSQTLNGVTIMVNEDKSIRFVGTPTAGFDVYLARDLPNLEEGLTYTLSSNTTLPVGVYLRIRNNASYDVFYTLGKRDDVDDSDLTFVYDNRFTSGSYSAYIWFGSYSVGTPVDFTIYPQLEKSPVATEYEQYKSNTSLIVLDEPLRSLSNGLKDIAYIKNGKLYVNRYVGSRVFTGDENWVTNVISISNGTIFSVPRGDMKANITTNYMSSHFIPRSTPQSPWNNGSVSTGNSYLNICMTDISTVDEFKTWLAENKPQVDYVLSNPYTEELGEISIKALDGTNNINLLANIETNFEIEYITGIDTIDEEFLKDVNVNFGEKYGKVNSIVLSRSAQSDNVYLQDETSVEENGLTELKIIDNQIMNGNDRSDYLHDILDKLNGLEYYINDFVSTGICYYDLCDRYKVKIGDTIYTCVMFNDEILITQGLQENIYTDMPEETQTDYTKADKTDRRINQAYIIVDKQNQEIQALASKVIDVSNTISGSGSIELENAHNGILNELSIWGSLSLLFPSENLYPSSDLYPLNFALQVDDEIYDLDIDYLNYMNANVFDKFIYKNGKCQIIRKVGVDNQGNLYELENEIVEEKKDVIINVSSNSTITSLNFPNVILSATYLTQNDYTDVFAAQVEVRSEINQTANSINLKVDKKLDGEDFNGANIVLEINKDTSLATIDADKISLKGKEINLTGDNTIITSNNFNVDADGNMTCKNANLNNANIKNGTIHITQEEGEAEAMYVKAISNGNLYKTTYGAGGSSSKINDVLQWQLASAGNPHLYLYNNGDRTILMNGTNGFIEANEIWVNGDLNVLGEKNRVIKIEDNKYVSLNAYETATPYFGDIGSDETNEDGYCKVEIDNIFAQTIEKNDYKVFIQECGDGKLYVEKHNNYFEVKGTPNLNFDWEVKAIQKGYKNIRLKEKIKESDK